MTDVRFQNDGCEAGYACKSITAYPVPKKKRRISHMTDYRVTDYRGLTVFKGKFGTKLTKIRVSAQGVSFRVISRSNKIFRVKRQR